MSRHRRPNRSEQPPPLKLAVAPSNDEPTAEKGFDTVIRPVDLKPKDHQLATQPGRMTSSVLEPIPAAPASLESSVASAATDPPIAQGGAAAPVEKKSARSDEALGPKNGKAGDVEWLVHAPLPEKRRLRREESVIAEVALAKRHPIVRAASELKHRVADVRYETSQSLQKWWMKLSSVKPRVGGSAAAPASGSNANVSISTRFWSMSTKKKALLVGAPYLVAALLVTVLLRDSRQSVNIPTANSSVSGQRDRAAAEEDAAPSNERAPGPEPAPDPTLAPSAAALAHATSPGASGSAAGASGSTALGVPAPGADHISAAAALTAPSAEPEPALPGAAAALALAGPIAAAANAPAAALEPPPPPPPAPEASSGAQVREERRTLPIRAALFAMPVPKAKKTAILAAGTELVIYPDFPAPEGWTLARKPNGEVGFLKKARLEGRSEPKSATKPRTARSPKKARKSTERHRLDDSGPVEPSGFTIGRKRR